MENEKELYKNIKKTSRFIKNQSTKEIRTQERKEILRMLKTLIQQDKLFTESPSSESKT
jgi:hypothetical protein